MEAMMHLELTFCGFEGTRRMRRAMVGANLPEPRFRQVEANSYQVHATLENDIQARKGLVTVDLKRLPSEDVFESMSDDEKRIVSYLSNVAEVNITNAALLVGRSWPTASRLIAGLVERGVLEPQTKRGRVRDSTKTYRLKSAE